MQFISSDTNVWIDFAIIDQLEIPFRLPYTYIMCEDAIHDELLSPTGLGEKLISFGLVPVAITIDEFFLAEDYGTLYPKLSIYDRIALAISKKRQITLLTGDRELRKAAKKEHVSFMGTLGVLDALWDSELITADELRICLQKMRTYNGGSIRLPDAEILFRLSSIQKGDDPSH